MSQSQSSHGPTTATTETGPVISSGGAIDGVVGAVGPRDWLNWRKGEMRARGHALISLSSLLGMGTGPTGASGTLVSFVQTPWGRLPKAHFLDAPGLLPLFSIACNCFRPAFLGTFVHLSLSLCCYHSILSVHRFVVVLIVVVVAVAVALFSWSLVSHLLDNLHLTRSLVDAHAHLPTTISLTLTLMQARSPPRNLQDHPGSCHALGAYSERLSYTLA
ncbi:hypothetical protein G7046_g5177 [Stylonectria norvegica]|nr:hypothetical protein G7046_g5177 [Stylonectria norvegica]